MEYGSDDTHEITPLPDEFNRFAPTEEPVMYTVSCSTNCAFSKGGAKGQSKSVAAGTSVTVYGSATMPSDTTMDAIFSVNGEYQYVSAYTFEESGDNYIYRYHYTFTVTEDTETDFFY